MPFTCGITVSTDVNQTQPFDLFAKYCEKSNLLVFFNIEFLHKLLCPLMVHEDIFTMTLLKNVVHS